tara:strand:- start:41 stop:370 length:330 start_codon:yes stop_codon:yes gene_type:complete
MIWIVSALTASILINILGVWYVSKILSKLLYTSDNLGDLYLTLRVYEEYVDELFQMDMFFGEPVIEGLIDRTKMVRQELEKFEEIYNLTTEIEYAEEENVVKTYEEEEK